jgi:hypothetical protein
LSLDALSSADALVVLVRRDTLAGVNPYWRIGWSIGLRGSAHMRR